MIWPRQLAQDLRYAARVLWHSPAFVVTTVLTLAVGLALATIVFTVFNAYVLRPFAVHDPYSLHEIAWRSRDDGGRRFAWRDYQELRGRVDLFDAVVAQRTHYVSSNGQTLVGAFVSGNYFDTLRARVVRGRPLAAFDAQTPGSAPVAVLSHPAWARLFDRDPAVIGRSLDVNGQKVVIVGVMGPEFNGLDDDPHDLWLPLTMAGPLAKMDLFGLEQRPDLDLVARVRRGVTAEQAQQALMPFVARAVQAAREVEDRRRGSSASHTGTGADVAQAVVRPSATPNPLSLELVAMLSPVFLAFGLVLAAACANVSNVMLARANARHREIAVRLSLGASRGRVVRQLVTEGLLLSVLAGVAGLAVAGLALSAGTALLFRMLPATAATLIRVAPLDFDARVFLFAFGVALATTVMFALLPALRATRLELTSALRGEAGAGVRAAALRSLLVASQVAVSLVLLIAASTLVRNGSTLGATELGFETRDVFSVNQRGDGPSLAGRASTELAADPRVAQVAVASRNPLFGQRPRAMVTPLAGGGASVAPYAFVSPEYFSLLRIAIQRGRTFRPDEAQSEAHVAVVSAATAARLWPGGDPIGQRLRIESPERGDTALAGYSDLLVVGVAKDVVSEVIYEGRDAAQLYMPTSAEGARASALLVRAHPGGELRADRLRRLLERAHPDPQIFEVVPLAEMRDVQIFPLRAAYWIGSALGFVALSLSVSGLYGVLIYTLGQRTREIGIRMALGATAGSVVALVMRQSARLVALGAAAGLVFAFGTLKVLSALITLQNVSVLDATAFAVGLGLVIGAAGLAAFVPASRASRIDPSTTLRADA
jgi:predicted permease